MCLKDEYISSGALTIKNLDVQVTERCSLKCSNCSNLMQYYERPVNEDLGLLFSTLDRFMECIDKIYEFRVLGGDPFMNKEVYKIINKLVEYNNVNYNGIIDGISCYPNQRYSNRCNEFEVGYRKCNEII